MSSKDEHTPGKYATIMGRFEGTSAVGGHVSPSVAAAISKARRARARKRVLELVPAAAGKSASELDALVDATIDLEDKAAQANYVAWKQGKAPIPAPASTGIKLSRKQINAVIDEVLAPAIVQAKASRPFASFDDLEYAFNRAEQKSQSAIARRGPRTLR